MRINFKDRTDARKQQVGLLHRIMENGHELHKAMRMVSDLGKTLDRDELAEIHVFISEKELDSADIQHDVLRREISRGKKKVAAKIQKDGYCIAFAVRRERATA